MIVRRAAIGTMLSAEQLLQIADTLTATGAFYRFRMRLDGRVTQLTFSDDRHQEVWVKAPKSNSE